jgi:hypothetical protein
VSTRIKVVVGGGALLLTLAALAVFFVDVESIFRDRAMRSPADACPRLQFSQRRCDAVVARALEGAGVQAADVLSVELGRPDGIRVNLGGQLAAVARLHLADGRIVDHEVWCIGIGSENDAWCVDDPLIQLWSDANHDVPCTGEDAAGTPTGCATPIVLDPGAVAQARALRVDAIDLPATVGRHDVELGRAMLPNGFLDKASFSLADPAPDGVSVPEGIRLVVAPTDPSRPPFGNAYERGTFPGVEEVVVSLVFDVVAAPPNTVLQVRDVVVE